MVYRKHNTSYKILTEHKQLNSDCRHTHQVLSAVCTVCDGLRSTPRQAVVTNVIRKKNLYLYSFFWVIARRLNFMY